MSHTNCDETIVTKERLTISVKQLDCEEEDSKNILLATPYLESQTGKAMAQAVYEVLKNLWFSLHESLATAKFGYKFTAQMCIVLWAPARPSIIEWHRFFIIHFVRSP